MSGRMKELKKLLSKEEFRFVGITLSNLKEFVKYKKKMGVC